MIAVVLMTAGVGLFGTLSGLVAAWFLSPENQEQENEIESLRYEVQRIRELLEERNRQDAA